MKKILFPIFLMMSLGYSTLLYAAKLALVIDDFGYRTKNEQQIITLSPAITVAVLPDAPNAAHIATFAYEHGNDVIIHLPMAPITKQPLEVNTLTPNMSEEEIQSIIHSAVEKVPYAIGLNNHMGSLMTSDLSGMQKVMKVLSDYTLFFLDSRTIAASKAREAANQYHIPVIERNFFLDDSQNEKDIEIQFDRAAEFARKHGYAVVIGHPYTSTVNVLIKKLSTQPDDIKLIKASSLIPTKEPSRLTLKMLLEICSSYYRKIVDSQTLLKKASTIENNE